MSGGFQLQAPRPPRRGDGGKWWEGTLGSFHARYQREGRALIVHTHPETRHVRDVDGRNAHVAVYAGVAAPDFQGTLPPVGRSFVADAKEFHGPRWDFKDLRVHQAEHLDFSIVLGGGSYLLIRSVEGMTAWLVPWRKLAGAWWAWQRTPGKAPPGTASMSWAQLRSLALYEAPPYQFDYLEALVLDMVAHRVRA